MEAAEIRALREELERQQWLDATIILMKAAGSLTRMRILYLLWRQEEVCVNDLADTLELTTPAISQQLKKLRNAQVVLTRRDAQTIYYRLNRDVEFVQCLIYFFSRETGASHRGAA